MTKLYQDKERLYKKYWDEELSIHKIAKLCGISNTTIYKYLKRFNISRRSNSEAIHLGNTNHFDLSQEAIDWISGELLGDGSLRSRSPYLAKFTYSSKYKEYIQYISNTLNAFGIKQSGKIYERYHKNMDCYDYQYTSLDYVELLPIYRKWYPEGKKIVPKDIELTPLTLRQHYIGDGYFKHPKNGNPSIIFYTNNFSIFDVNWLVNKLLNLGFYTTRRKSNNTIGISAYSTKSFLDYIGRCPVKCYQYKWGY